MSINIDLTKTQKYLEWTKTMLYLDSRADGAKRRSVKRGEVYKCNLGMGIGSEECKERPCVVIQYDAGNANSPNTIVAPITHSTSTLPIVVPIKNQYGADGKLILDGNVLLGNIVSISKVRLGNFVTSLEQDEMKSVDEAIAISIDIKRHYDKLNNIYNDKLEYIQKLKTKIKDLENEMSSKNDDLQQFYNLKEQLNLESLKELIEYIEEEILQKSMDK